ncbi:MAG: ferredoxin-type protein NapF [Rhodobacteraceae bacterium]|nr:ferredoxin-type protein NapF [Paracoccaceae bacterium]
MSSRPDVSVSRRAFLKFASQPKSDSIRPPWSDEASILAHCTECKKCFESCPEKIIKPGNDRGPVLDFSSGACTFCGACAEACPSGALDRSREFDWPWRADVSDKCLSLQAITCRACEDACEPQAIRFKLAIGGASEPIVDIDQCTGCGACAYGCPVAAITFKRLQPEQQKDPT